MKTVLAYVLGFTMTFTVIAGGMYFLSEKYPWMFGHADAQTISSGQPKSASSDGPAGPNGTADSTKGVNETIRMLKKMLADKNDTIRVRNDSIRTLKKSLTQLQLKSSDANSVISRLQSRVNSWKSKSRMNLANAYNDMNPAAAARIMKSLDDPDIIFILSNIQNKQAGKILGDMNPARAARLMMSLKSSK